ncbi:MAG: ABC transporter ATP-binding protein [Firmicutes bacterium]|nr:ABC transporter ATP-binding protein [Bacillota bacterium]
MIEVKDLTKKYGTHKAVDNISFTVNDGEILGFLGPNGAGKTTTMNIMTGYLSSTECTVKINGFDILDEPEKAKKQIGYLPDVPPLYGDMTVKEYLNFVADIKTVKKSERSKMLEEIAEIVKIKNVWERVIKNLSKGYRQRVGLAQALVGFPEVLILDEPTNGLDPKQIIEMRDVIKALSEKHTVILSSHILSEVSAVCDRVMIINKGKIVASDTPEKLSENITQGHRIAVRIKAEREKIESVFEGKEEFESLEFNAQREEGTCEISVKGVQDSDIRELVFNICAENKMPILMMKPLDLSLEEIFLQVTEGGENVGNDIADTDENSDKNIEAETEEEEIEDDEEYISENEKEEGDEE